MKLVKYIKALHDMNHLFHAAINGNYEEGNHSLQSSNLQFLHWLI